VGALAFGIHGDDDALGAVVGGAVIDDLGVFDSGGVDSTLVGTSVENGFHVIDGADASAYGEGDKALFGGASDNVVHGVTAVRGGGDVEEDDFVSFLFVIGDGGFDRVTCVTEIDEVGSFNDAAIGDVETGDDSLGEVVDGGWHLDLFYRR